MNISQNIISKFGGVRAMARSLGIPVTTIQYWWEEGRIPSKKQQFVLDSAQKMGIEVKAEHFFAMPTIPDKRKPPERNT